MKIQPTHEEVDELYVRLDSEARARGYHLNPDKEFTLDIVQALLTNTMRYGYQACPCRLPSGTRSMDLDIICPCDYRDPDLAEFGACYCALYVSEEIARGEREAEPIPERRKKPSDTETRGPTFAKASAGKHGDAGEKSEAGSKSDAETRGHGDAGGNVETESRTHGGTEDLEYPVWRCPVCGYLCAREHPPEKCPICGADKDRFQRFL